MMKPIIKTVRHLISRNASDLLLAGGVSCIIGGGALAIRQTPKATKILEDNNEKDNITKIKAVAPLFIPAVGLTVLGITQIVCSRNITKNKIAAITTAYTVSETAYKTYRDKVKEMVEPERYEEIKREVATEKLRKDPLGSKEVIVQSESESLVYDSMSGRYFKSNINDIDKAVNYLNKQMRNDTTINLNDLYNEIGLPIVKIGVEMGWDIDKGYIEVRYDSGITEDGRPCIVLEYDVTPLR